MKKDFLKRLSHFHRINSRYTPIIFLLMPASILLAITISLLFGMSPDQFNIMEGQVLLSLLIPILAPTFEEIGWRGYGMCRCSLSITITIMNFGIVVFRILPSILFHIMTVLSAEAFHIEESVKFIQTAVLLIVAACIVIYDKAFFTTQVPVES